MLTCPVCSKPTALRAGIHPRCRIAELETSVGELKNVVRERDRQIEDLVSSATMTSELLSRYDFMRTYLMRKCGVDILPTHIRRQTRPETQYRPFRS